jgi:hypothetical protein
VWVYHQSSGALHSDGQLIATGYAGTAEGRNNPAMEMVRSIGPLPAGLYAIRPAIDRHPTMGPRVIPLVPVNHDCLGRNSFYVHGDNDDHDASRGCPIFPRAIRLAIAATTETPEGFFVVIP